MKLVVFWSVTANAAFIILIGVLFRGWMTEHKERIRLSKLSRTLGNTLKRNGKFRSSDYEVERSYNTMERHA